VSQHIDTGHIDGRAWCGVHRNSLEWRFTDASHALLALRDGTGIGPCSACLRAMREIIDAELAPDPPDRDPTLAIPQRP
jgi:hypothetical protein